MRIREHVCGEVPTTYLGFSVAVTRVLGSVWDLEAYLADEYGLTESSFTVKGIGYCPWCGQKLGEETE